MLTLAASVPLGDPPAWAVLERTLIDVMDRSVYLFLDKYTHPDGTLIWAEIWKNSRDGADDLYESSYNWPLYYLVGGGDHLLTLGQRQWDAITRQLTKLGPVLDEYERGYDQFHQGESYIYFYILCLADPGNERNRERALRFAGLFLNENPNAPNYDAERKLIRAPHNGSGGPRWGYNDSPEPSYGWSAAMRAYGMPYTDIPGIKAYDDLKDPVLARRMGEAMQERMGKGDVAVNLVVTSLIANAFLPHRRGEVPSLDRRVRGTRGENGPQATPPPRNRRARLVNRYVKSRTACCRTIWGCQVKSANTWAGAGTADCTAGAGRTATTTSAWLP